MAQTGSQQKKASLDAAPVAVETEKPETIVALGKETKPTAASMPVNRVSYGLSVGSSFGRGFGATFIEPSVRYQVSERFRVFGSFTYMNVMSQQMAVQTPEGNTMLQHAGPSSHYMMNAGVDYLVNDRLVLSGSVWRDFSNMPMPAQNRMYNGLFQPSRNGADFRATYKITDNLSITGGVRYSDGGSLMQSPFYGPGFSGYRSSSPW